jgi:hypothetical protein
MLPAVTLRASCRALSVVVVSLVMADSLEASPVLFPDRATFTNVAQPNRTLPLQGLSVSNCDFVFPGPFCHATFDNLLFVNYDFAGIGLFNDGVGIDWVFGLSAAHSFLTPVTAIGFDLVRILPAGFAQGPPSADFFGFSFAGTQFAIPLGSDPIFFGAIFDTPQTTIPAHVVPGGVSGPQDGFVITNLAVRTVPEPATLALFGAAAALLLGARRRRIGH